MPAARVSGNRRFLMVAAGLAFLMLLAAAIFSAGGRAESRGYPSSYSRASDGALAAFLLLQELDLEIERWEQPPTELPQEPGSMVLIIAEPTLSASAEEKVAIKQFAAKGGTVLATGIAGAGLIPGGNAGWLPEQFEWRNLKPQIPSSLVRDVQEIRIEPSVRWLGKLDAVRVFADQENAYVVTYPHGAGRIVWWATSTPLSNAGLSTSQNLQFFLNSLGIEQGPRIFWDEYFHGVRRSLWSYLRSTPAPWALAQILCAFALALVTFARRHGPLRAPVVETRLHPLEFVRTLGSLYQHAQAAPFAVGSIYQRFRHRLLRHLGLPASASASALAHAAQERRGHLSNLQETLEAAERCASGAKVSKKEALQLAERLQEFAEQLGLNPLSQQRKT